jgi:hypothetical protein
MNPFTKKRNNRQQGSAETNDRDKEVSNGQSVHILVNLYKNHAAASVSFFKPVLEH